MTIGRPLRAAAMKPAGMVQPDSDHQQHVPSVSRNPTI
jgi:hypothetical protein